MIKNLNKLIILSILVLIPSVGQSQISPAWEFKTWSAIYGGANSDKKNIYFGNEGGELYSLTIQGDMNWMIQLDGAIKSTPALSDNTLYINTDKGLLYALNSKNGSTKWIIQFGEERRYDLWDYYLSSPVIANGKIYLGAGDGNVYCIGLSDGSVLWKYKTDGIVHSSAVIDGNSLFIGGFDGYLYSLDTNTGKLLWKFDTEGSKNYPNGEIQKKVIIHENAVFVTCRGNFLYKIDKASGEKLASYFEPGSWIIATPVIAQQSILFGTSDSQKIRCLDIKSLTEIWSSDVTMRIYSKGILNNDSAYFMTFDGRIFKADISNGALTQFFQSNQSKNSYPLIYNDEGHFRKDILQLYGSNIPAAEELLLSLGSFVAEGLTVNDELLIVGDSEGTLSTFKLP